MEGNLYIKRVSRNLPVTLQYLNYLNPDSNYKKYTIMTFETGNMNNYLTFDKKIIFRYNYVLLKGVLIF